MARPQHEMRVIGTRHGEKLYETLLSREEMAAAEDLGAYYRIPPDLRDLNYGKYVEEGEPGISVARTTTRTTRPGWTSNGMVRLLHKLTFVQALARGEARGAGRNRR